LPSDKVSFSSEPQHRRQRAGANGREYGPDPVSGEASPLLSRLVVPFLTTMHGRIDLPGLSDVIRAFPDAAFVSISDHRLPVPDANWIGTIQHGLPSSLLRPS
jgi:hypothetical protein